MLEEFLKYGIFGVFLTSFFANAIPFVGLPYLNLLLLFSPFFDLTNLLTFTLASAFGAALGKVVIYFFGRSFGFVLPESTRENLEFFRKLFEKWGVFAIFLFAATPMPDDVLYIPLAMAKFKLKSYFAAIFLGKLFVTSAAVLGGKILFFAVESVGFDFWQSFVFFAALTTIFTILVLKINWKNIFERYQKVV